MPITILECQPLPKLKKLARILKVHIHKDIKQSELTLLLSDHCLKFGIDANRAVAYMAKTEAKTSKHIARIASTCASRMHPCRINKRNTAGSAMLLPSTLQPKGIILGKRQECIDCLCIRRTRQSGNGLYTLSPIDAGQLVGFYTGERYFEPDFESLMNTKQRQKYAVGLQSLKREYRHQNDAMAKRKVIISPPLDATGNVDPHLYPIACANEPLEHHTANCAPLMLVIRRASLKKYPCTGLNIGKRKVIRCIALIASRNIGAEEEITWSYGDDYCPIRQQEKYVAGSDCTLDERLTNVNQILGSWNRAIPIQACDVHVRKNHV